MPTPKPASQLLQEYITKAGDGPVKMTLRQAEDLMERIVKVEEKRRAKADRPKPPPSQYQAFMGVVLKKLHQQNDTRDNKDMMRYAAKLWQAKKLGEDIEPVAITDGSRGRGRARSQSRSRSNSRSKSRSSSDSDPSDYYNNSDSDVKPAPRRKAAAKAASPKPAKAPKAPKAAKAAAPAKAKAPPKPRAKKGGALW